MLLTAHGKSETRARKKFRDIACDVKLHPLKDKSVAFKIFLLSKTKEIRVPVPFGRV